MLGISGIFNTPFNAVWQSSLHVVFVALTCTWKRYSDTWVLADLLAIGDWPL